eukprot:scaffold1086_cov121-Amphora_coffeaeformis.AAC.4
MDPDHSELTNVSEAARQAASKAAVDAIPYPVPANDMTDEQFKKEKEAIRNKRSRMVKKLLKASGTEDSSSVASSISSGGGQNFICGIPLETFMRMDPQLRAQLLIKENNEKDREALAASLQHNLNGMAASFHHSVNAMAATHRHATTAQTLRNLSYNSAMNPKATPLFPQAQMGQLLQQFASPFQGIGYGMMQPMTIQTGQMPPPMMQMAPMQMQRMHDTEAFEQRIHPTMFTPQ